MAKLIHPQAPHGGDQYGTTIQKSKPIISFPKSQTSPGFGKQTHPVKPVGGTQFGTTQQDSKPYGNFPNARVPLNNGMVDQRGSAMKVDSEKVVSSKQGDGMSIKSQNTRASGDTCGLGVQQKVHYPKKGQKGNSTPKVF